MMAPLRRGKLIFIFAAILLCAATRVVSAVLNPADELELPVESSNLEPPVQASRQEALIGKLEEIVKNLTEIVARLEPILSNPQKLLTVDKGDVSTPPESDRLEGNMEGEKKDSNGGKAVSVTKYSLFWSERFQLVSAVRLTSHATCINVLPFRDQEGVSKYVAVGDERGKVFVFLRNGDVLVEFYAHCDSPVTAIVSYLAAHKNESFVVTGHQSGAIMMHKASDWSIGEDMNSFSMEHVGRLSAPEHEEGDLAVSILEVHHVGRSRYILASDASGKLMVFKENGTFHGSVMPTSKPLAFLKQRLLFLTENGAGSLDIRTMKIREAECEGLNYSVSRYYVFDATERSKAYGYTSDGDLIHVLLLGDVMNFKCRVRSKRKIDMGSPLALQAIKGYLLVANEEKVFVFNVSSHHYVRVGGPRLLYSVGLDEIRLSFLSYHGNEEAQGGITVLPLFASDREKLFILSLGSGYLGMFRSNLPVFKGEVNTVLWTSPVLVFLVFLFGAWQFFAKKKEALTSWGPDDPFNTSPVAPVPATAASTGDRSFMERTSRGGGDMRGLRVPSRWYGSPPGFSRDASASYRQGGNDSNGRLSGVEPSFRPSAELKYRGPSLDPGAFSKRREGIYINTQSVDNNQ